MPAPTSTFIQTANQTAISFALEPAHNVLHSMMLLNKVNDLSGYNQWLVDTAVALTPQQAHNNLLVLEGLHYAARPKQSWPSFPTFLDHLAQQDPVVLRDQILAAYIKMPRQTEIVPAPVVQPTDMLATLGTYLDFIQSRFSDDCINIQIETEAFALLKEPHAMQRLIVTHLQDLWVNYFEAEWNRTTPLLQASVKAFQQLNLQNLSANEAAQEVIGRELPPKWQQLFESGQLRQVVFVPLAHIGPYLGTFEDEGISHLFIGARHPQGVPISSPELSRSELLIRLGALSDDNRLQVLQIVSEAGELCSKDIMEQLQLSQSATSRHLKQLAATGYLDEQWCDGAKWYTISSDRIRNTLGALEQFLLG